MATDSFPRPLMTAAHSTTYPRQVHLHHRRHVSKSLDIWDTFYDLLFYFVVELLFFVPVCLELVLPCETGRLVLRAFASDAGTEFLDTDDGVGGILVVRTESFGGFFFTAVDINFLPRG